MHTAHCILQKLYCTLHTTHYTKHTTQYTQHTTHCTIQVSLSVFTLLAMTLERHSAIMTPLAPRKSHKVDTVFFIIIIFIIFIIIMFVIIIIIGIVLLIIISDRISLYRSYSVFAPFQNLKIDPLLQVNPNQGQEGQVRSSQVKSGQVRSIYVKLR